MKKYLLFSFFIPLLALSCSSDNKTLEKDTPKENVEEDTKGDLDPDKYYLTSFSASLDLLEGQDDCLFNIYLWDNVLDDIVKNLYLKDIEYEVDNDILELVEIPGLGVFVKALRPGTATLNISHRGLTSQQILNIYPKRKLKVPHLTDRTSIGFIDVFVGKGAKGVKYTTIKKGGLFYTEAEYIFDGYSYFYTLCSGLNLEKNTHTLAEVVEISMKFTKDVKQMSILLELYSNLNEHLRDYVDNGVDKVLYLQHWNTGLKTETVGYDIHRPSNESFISSIRFSPSVIEFPR